MRKTIRYAQVATSWHAYLALIERLLPLQRCKSNRPQIFIFGLPRSGTTLIYQYIVHRLNVAYFTNGVGQYFCAPCITTFLQHTFHGTYQSDFESNYGKVQGSVAPREAGSFWGRFFGLDNYITYEAMKPKQIQTLRCTVACVQQIFGDVPFVNKNVKHMLRLDALSQVFPNAFFLLVERDLHNVALSVLRGRQKNLNDPRQWWSVKPPNYHELKDLSVTEQIAYQLVSLQQKLEADCSKIAPERMLRIEYDQFCRNPEQLVELLGNKLGPIAFRNPAQDLFVASDNKPQTVEQHKLINLINHVA